MANSIVQQYLTAVQSVIQMIPNPELERIETGPTHFGSYLKVESRHWTLLAKLEQDARTSEWSATVDNPTTSTQRSYALTLLNLIDAVETFNDQQALWAQVKATYQEYNTATAVMKCMVLFSLPHETASQAVSERIAAEGWRSLDDSE